MDIYVNGKLLFRIDGTTTDKLLLSAKFNDNTKLSATTKLQVTAKTIKKGSKQGVQGVQAKQIKLVAGKPIDKPMFKRITQINKKGE